MSRKSEPSEHSELAEIQRLYKNRVESGGADMVDIAIIGLRCLILIAANTTRRTNDARTPR